MSSDASETFELERHTSVTHGMSSCGALDSIASSAEEPVEPSSGSQRQTDGLLQDDASFSNDDSLSLTASQHGTIHDNKGLARYWWERIGKRALATLVFGTWLVLGALGLLSFLWIESHRANDGGYPGTAWKTIVFSGWTTIFIAISSALIRTIVASQMAVLTAMLASLFLETAGVQLQHLPALSIVRAVNLSPFSLLGSHLFQIHKVHSASRAVYAILVVMLSLLVLVSQFISSMLLSDFSTVSIAGQNASHTVPCDYASPRAPMSGIPFIEPVFSPRFAEYREPFRTGSNSLDSTYVDTGTVLRAAIPWIDRDSRRGLRYYAGPIRVWDARVVCFSPTLENATFGASVFPSSFHGSFVISGSHPVMDIPEEGTVQFNCTLGNATDSISICLATGFRVPFKLSTTMTTITTEKTDRSETYIIVKQGLPLPPDTEARLTNDSPPVFSLAEGAPDAHWPTRREGAWAKTFDSSGLERLSFTACTTNDVVYDGEGSMFGPPAVEEPAFQVAGKLGNPEPLVDTLGVLRQLGVAPDSDKLSIEDRGLLPLDVLSDLVISTRYHSRHGLSPIGWDTVAMLKPEPDNSSGFRDPEGTKESKDEHKEYLTLHETLAKVFREILDTTNNPAFGIQALSTILIREAYYRTSPGEFSTDSLIHKDENTTHCTIVYSMSKDTYIPVRKTGLLSVIGIIAAYYALLITVILLFTVRTHVSLLGSSWQAVAQVVSDDTWEVLDRADKLKDVEVEKYLKDSAPGWNARGLIRRRKDGRERFEVEKRQILD